MAVSKSQHTAHSNMITKAAKFFGPKTASAQFSGTKTYSTIPGVGKPFPSGAPPKVQTKPFVSSLPRNQKTFGVPGAK